MRARVAIALFDGVEVLDAAGPFEVFAVASELRGHAPFEVLAVGAEAGRVVRAVNGLRFVAERGWADLPRPAVLVVPGGEGVRAAIEDPALMAWVRDAAASAQVVLSVCTGSLLLGALGLLDGLEATTHHLCIDELRERAPGCRVRPDLRVVDAGRIVTCGGISAGIDGSFHALGRLLGPDAVAETAAYMEYRLPAA